MRTPSTASGADPAPSGPRAPTGAPVRRFPTTRRPSPATVRPHRSRSRTTRRSIHCSSARRRRLISFALSNANLVINSGIANGSSFAPTFTNTQEAATAFFNGSSAANARIFNNQLGFTQFFNSSSAGTATIVNDGVLVSTNDFGGTTNFNDSSTAASATIFTRNNGQTAFFQTSTAGSATIVNSTNGALDRSMFLAGGSYFFATSSAGNATIINNGGGIAYFGETSSAGERHHHQQQWRHHVFLRGEQRGQRHHRQQRRRHRRPLGPDDGGDDGRLDRRRRPLFHRLEAAHGRFQQPFDHGEWRHRRRRFGRRRRRFAGQGRRRDAHPGGRQHLHRRHDAQCRRAGRERQPGERRHR